MSDPEVVEGPPPDPLALIDLRLQFLTEASHLGLVPPGLQRHALLSAASGRGATEAVRRLGAICDALLEGRGESWPSIPDRSQADRDDPAPARRHSAGEASPRAAAERLGQVCQPTARPRRKRTGSYYTPGWVADLIAKTLVGGLTHGRKLSPETVPSLRVLDPAAGAGAFMVAMVEAIAEAMGETEAENTIRRAVVSECIRGVEIDPLAAEACRLALWLVSSRPGRPAAVSHEVVSVRDSLVEPPQPRSFDIVIGNPPWGVRLPEQMAQALAARAPRALSGHRDSFLFFLHLAAEAVRDDGAVGMALPDAVLSQTKYAGMRRRLLERFRPLRVALLGNKLFPGATAPACALCMVGSQLAPSHFVISDLRKARPEPGAEDSSWSAPTDAPAAAAHHSFLAPPHELGRMLGDLCARNHTLGELAETFRFHDSGVNYPTAELGRALLYTGPRQHPADSPVTRGRDFNALTIPGSSAWLRHDWRSRAGRSGVSVREELYRAAPKLLFRQTGDRPVATVDRGGVHFGRSVIAITGPSESDLLWLAAVMNSATFAALYRALAPETGRTFAQVKVAKLKLVPVPPLAADYGLAELAKAILEQTDPAPRRELLSQLDDKVAEAYGLSPSQRRFVAQLIGPRPAGRVRRGGRARPAGTS